MFQSKRDGWPAGVLAGAGLGLALGGVAAANTAETWDLRALGSVLLIGAVLVLWVLAGTYYLVTESDLVVRCGPLRWRIPLASIETIVPTREAAGGPALSLDRFRVACRAPAPAAILVSPAEREEFLDEVGRRAGHLKHEGDRLVPAAR